MNALTQKSFTSLNSVTGSWVKCRIADIAQKANSGLAQGELTLEPQGYPAYGASGLIGHISTFHMEEPFIAIVKDGAGVGNIIRCPAKSSAIGTLDCLVGRNGCSTEFLGILLTLMNFKKYEVGSTIPHIYFRDYKDAVVTLPPADEQKFICHTFASLNVKIDALKAKKSALEDYKRGLMQKLFSREIRFTREDGSSFAEWKKAPLSAIGSLRSGIGFPESEQGGTEGIPFYKVSDMNTPENLSVMHTANNYVKESQIKRLKYKPISQPSIIFAKVGAAIFLERKRRAQNFLMDNNMMAFLPNDEITIDFSVHLFSQLRLCRFAQTGALPSYNASDVGDLMVEFPQPEEQERISELLSLMNTKVAAATKLIVSMEAFKKGLLQKLLA